MSTRRTDGVTLTQWEAKQVLKLVQREYRWLSEDSTVLPWVKARYKMLLNKIGGKK